MAILMAACFQSMDPAQWQIFASDISTLVLEKAGVGIYPERQIHLPNRAWLPRYFQKGAGEWDGYYRVKQALRDQIDFQPMNLLQPTSARLNRYDVIFCRNVMIYFDQATAHTLAERLYHQLHEGGYLIIGHAESVGRKPRGLEPIKPSIFRKISRPA